MRISRGFATLEILVVILIVLATGGLFYFIGKSSNSTPSPQPSPTPEAKDEMSEWETYVNNEMQISFRYPKDWESLAEDNSRTEFEDATVIKEFPNSFVNQEYCTVERDCYPVARIKLSFVESQPIDENLIDRGQKLTEKTTNSLQYKSFYRNETAPYPYATYFTLPNGKILLADAWLPSHTNCMGECPLYEDSQEIIRIGKEIDQILSTFEFID